MQRALSGGSLSFRNLFLFVASLVATIFATLFVTAAPVSAADAQWQGSSITYNNTTFTGPKTTAEGSELDLPTNTITYVNTGSNDYRLIYFPAGSNPSEQESATYVTYRIDNSGRLSNRSNPVQISIDVSNAPDPNAEATADGVTSCDVSGIGYIVCPITTFFAEGMDWVFDVLKTFVEVKPLTTDSDSAMRRAWDVMRNFANVAFVIGFIIIIYSQLTSVGMSNYGIKKLLPRIIIAAILVNVSYWICAIAIDISNILGSSLQGVFIGIRDLINIELTQPTWKELTTFILSGGALGAMAAGGFVLTAASIGSIGGLVFLLLPLLVGAATTVLVVVFILAARQALITILVIIAPLAFVAYLLPNTEKWFDKWRGIFMTMLIFYPAFSLVFGGSQLAGSLIISNAGGDIVILILGMAVQIAPLAITPLLLKLSGTLLSRIGGLVNDPTRGFKDRTKNWSKDRRENYRANQMAKSRQMAREGKLKGRHAVRRSAVNSDNLRRLREARKATSDTQADTYFNQTDTGKAIDSLQRSTEREKQIVQQELDKTWNVKAKIDASSLERELKLRITADEANLAKVKMESIYEEVKAGDKEYVAGVFSAARNASTTDAAQRLAMLNRASDTTSFIAVEGMRKNAAEHEQKSVLASQLLDNNRTIDGKTLREYAGGIDEHGANSALATAVGIDRKQYNERVQEANAIIDHFNLSGAQRQAHAMGTGPVTVRDDSGRELVLDNDSIFTREAAIEAQLSGKGNLDQMEEIILNSGDSLKEFRTTISATMPKAATGKAGYWGGISIDNVAQGQITPDKLNAVVTRFIGQGKIKPTTLATMDLKAVQNIVDAYQTPDVSMLKPEDQAKLPTYLKALQKSAYEALTNEDLKGNVADNVQTELRKIVGDYKPTETEL